MADFSNIVDGMKGSMEDLVRSIVKAENAANSADKAINDLKNDAKDIEKVAAKTIRSISGIQTVISNKIKNATAENAKVLERQLEAVKEVERQMKKQGNTQKYATATKAEAAEGAVTNYKKGESFYGPMTRYFNSFMEQGGSIDELRGAIGDLADNISTLSTQFAASKADSPSGQMFQRSTIRDYYKAVRSAVKEGVGEELDQVFQNGFARRAASGFKSEDIRKDKEFVEKLAQIATATPHAGGRKSKKQKQVEADRETERVRSRKQVNLSMKENADSAERFAMAMHQVYETKKEINKLERTARRNADQNEDLNTLNKILTARRRSLAEMADELKGSGQLPKALNNIDKIIDKKAFNGGGNKRILDFFGGDKDFAVSVAETLNNPKSWGKIEFGDTDTLSSDIVGAIDERISAPVQEMLGKFGDIASDAINASMSEIQVPWGGNSRIAGASAILARRVRDSLTDAFSGIDEIVAAELTTADGALTQLSRAYAKGYAGLKGAEDEIDQTVSQLADSMSTAIGKPAEEIQNVIQKALLSSTESVFKGISRISLFDIYDKEGEAEDLTKKYTPRFAEVRTEKKKAKRERPRIEKKETEEAQVKSKEPRSVPVQDKSKTPRIEKKKEPTPTPTTPPTPQKPQRRSIPELRGKTVEELSANLKSEHDAVVGLAEQIEEAFNIRQGEARDSDYLRHLSDAGFKATADGSGKEFAISFSKAVNEKLRDLSENVLGGPGGLHVGDPTIYDKHKDAERYSAARLQQYRAEELLYRWHDRMNRDLTGASLSDIQAKKAVDLAYLELLRGMKEQNTGERFFTEDEIFDKFTGDREQYDTLQLFHELGNAFQGIERSLPQLNDLLLRTADDERKQGLSTQSDANVKKYASAQERRDELLATVQKYKKNYDPSSQTFNAGAISSETTFQETDEQVAQLQKDLMTLGKEFASFGRLEIQTNLLEVVQQLGETRVRLKETREEFKKTNKDQIAAQHIEERYKNPTPLPAPREESLTPTKEAPERDDSRYTKYGELKLRTSGYQIPEAPWGKHSKVEQARKDMAEQIRKSLSAKFDSGEDFSLDIEKPLEVLTYEYAQRFLGLKEGTEQIDAAIADIYDLVQEYAGFLADEGADVEFKDLNEFVKHVRNKRFYLSESYQRDLGATWEDIRADDLARYLFTKKPGPGKSDPAEFVSLAQSLYPNAGIYVEDATGRADTEYAAGQGTMGSVVAILDAIKRYRQGKERIKNPKLEEIPEDELQQIKAAIPGAIEAAYIESFKDVGRRKFNKDSAKDLLDVSDKEVSSALKGIQGAADAIMTAEQDIEAQLDKATGKLNSISDSDIGKQAQEFRKQVNKRVKEIVDTELAQLSPGELMEALPASFESAALNNESAVEQLARYKLLSETTVGGSMTKLIPDAESYKSKSPILGTAEKLYQLGTGIREVGQVISEARSMIAEEVAASTENAAGVDRATEAFTEEANTVAETTARVEELNAAEENSPGAPGAEAASEDFRQEGQAASEAAEAINELELAKKSYKGRMPASTPEDLEIIEKLPDTLSRRKELKQQVQEKLKAGNADISEEIAQIKELDTVVEDVFKRLSNAGNINAFSEQIAYIVDKTTQLSQIGKNTSGFMEYLSELAKQQLALKLVHDGVEDQTSSDFISFATKKADQLRLEADTSPAPSSSSTESRGIATEGFREERQAVIETTAAIDELNAKEASTDGAPGASSAAEDFREEAEAANAAADAAKKAREAASGGTTRREGTTNKDTSQSKDSYRTAAGGGGNNPPPDDLTEWLNALKTGDDARKALRNIYTKLAKLANVQINRGSSEDEVNSAKASIEKLRLKARKAMEKFSFTRDDLGFDPQDLSWVPGSSGSFDWQKYYRRKSGNNNPPPNGGNGNNPPGGNGNRNNPPGGNGGGGNRNNPPGGNGGGGGNGNNPPGGNGGGGGWNWNGNHYDENSFRWGQREMQDASEYIRQMLNHIMPHLASNSYTATVGGDSENPYVRVTRHVMRDDGSKGQSGSLYFESADQFLGELMDAALKDTQPAWDKFDKFMNYDFTTASGSATSRANQNNTGNAKDYGDNVPSDIENALRRLIETEKEYQTLVSKRDAGLTTDREIEQLERLKNAREADLKLIHDRDEAWKKEEAAGTRKEYVPYQTDFNSNREGRAARKLAEERQKASEMAADYRDIFIDGNGNLTQEGRYASSAISYFNQFKSSVFGSYDNKGNFISPTKNITDPTGGSLQADVSSFEQKLGSLIDKMAAGKITVQEFWDAFGQGMTRLESIDSYIDTSTGAKDVSSYLEEAIKKQAGADDKIRLGATKFSKDGSTASLIGTVTDSEGNITKYVASWDKASGRITNSISEIVEASEKLNNLAALDDDVQKFVSRFNDIEGKGIDNMEPMLDNARESLQKLTNEFMSGEINLEQYKEACTKLLTPLEKIKMVTDDSGDALSNMRRYLDEEAAQHGIKLDNSDIRTKTAKNGNITMQTTLDLGNRQSQQIVVDWNAATGAISQTNQEIQTGANLSKQFFGALSSGADKLGAQLATFFSLMDFIRYFKEGVSQVKEFDTALTEMRKVSNESVQGLRDFQKESFSIADSVGTTGLQIQQSTADFMRLGQSLEEAKKSAKNANLLMNISEFKSIDDATTSLIAMSSAFQDVSQEHILDSLNKVGNDFSISTEGLSEALQRSAASLVTSNNTFEEAVALMTAGNQIVQSPEKVGTAWNTIALRLTGTKQAKTQLEELGEDIDGVVTTQSKLRQIIMNATKVASNDYKGFDILDMNGQFKSTYEIVSSIADIWEEIEKRDVATGSTNQNLLLETMAGKRNANILASALQNPDILKKSFAEAQDSLGSAEQENEKYMASIEGKLKQLTNAGQEFWASFLKSDDLKMLITTANDLLGIINKIAEAASTITGGKFGMMNMFLGGATELLFKKNAKNGESFSILKALGSVRDAFKNEKPISIPFEAEVNSVDLGDINANVLDAGDVDLSGLEDIVPDFADATLNVRDFTEALGEAAPAASGLGSSISGLGGMLGKVGTVAASFGTSLLSGLKVVGMISAEVAIFAAISAAIGVAVKKFYEFAHAQEIAIEKGKEAREQINQSAEDYQNLQDSVDKLGKTSAENAGKESPKSTNESIESIGERYEKLKAGVGSNNKNLSLSNDQYAEFISLNNEIASLFPTLISGYDASGNAILNLGTKAGDAAKNLRELLEADRAVSYQKISDNLDEAYNGSLATIRELDRQNKYNSSVADAPYTLGIDRTQKQAIQDYLDTNYPGSYKYTEHIDGTMIPGFVFNSDTSIKDLNAINDYLSSNGFGIQIELNAEDRSTSRTERQANESQMRTNEAIMLSDAKKLIGSTIFDDADTDLQNAILSNFTIDSDLFKNYKKIGENEDATSEELTDYLFKNIISPVEELMKSGYVDDLVDLLNLDTSDLTLQEYENKINGGLQGVFEGNEDLFGGSAFDWRTNLGFDATLSDYQEKLNAIYKRAPQIGWQDLRSLKLSEISSAYEAVVNSPTDFNGTFKDLEAQIRDIRAASYEASGSFKDFLETPSLLSSGKTYSDIADELQTLASSVEEVETKLMSGDLDKSALKDLYKQFPELAENSKFLQNVTDNMDAKGIVQYSKDIQSALSEVKFKNATNVFKEYGTELKSDKEILDDMIADGADAKIIGAQKKRVQAIEAYMNALSDTFDFSGISKNAVWKGVGGLQLDKNSSFIKQGLYKELEAGDATTYEAIAKLILDSSSAEWSWEQWKANIEAQELKIKAKVDEEGVKSAASQIQTAISDNSTLQGAVTSAMNREFNTDSILNLINQFPVLTQQTDRWADIIGSIDSDGLVTNVEAVSDLVSGMTVENLSKLGTYFDVIADKANINSSVFDDLRKKIIDLSDLSSFSTSDLVNSEMFTSLPTYLQNAINHAASNGVPAEVLAKIILKGDIDLNSLDQDIQDGISQIEHRKYQAQISVLTTYNSDISSIRDAEAEIAQGTMTPDKALSLASSLPEVAKAAEELGLTFTDMNADEILDDVDKLQVALANAKFDRLERLLSDKNVGRAEKLSAIANADLSGNTRQNDYLAREGHVQNEWLANRLAGEGEFESTYGFGRESAYQTAVGVQMMLDAGSLENTEASVEQAFSALEPKVAIQLAEGSIRDIEQQITTISQVASDQMANGYITQEQLNTLKAAGIDYSQMLEVGAKGWKLNTEKVQEYEDALRAVQVAQSKQTENIAKDRVAVLDRQMRELLGEGSGPAKLAEEAGKNAANNFVSGMSSELETAARGGTTAYGKAEQETAKTSIAERIQAGASAQDLLDEGYGFQDLAAAQNYLDLSDARAELEETIQKQKQYQMATAASIDIAKQFSEASSAANDRDLAATVSGGVKGALETKNKGWWGDKNLQQYAKFFASEDTPLYRALDEFEKSWNDTWSKYYGADGEITDEGVQQFFKDSEAKGLLSLGSETITDKFGEYTQDWLIKDIDINKLAEEWDTSRENIIALLSEFEDTRSWDQVDWGSIFGNSESISSSTEAMQEYIDNLGILQKYNPDMDMGQYFETAASGLATLQSNGASSKEIEECVNQLNTLAELTGQDYRITITEDGNFDVVDTKLEEMHEKIDAINKSNIRINNGKVEILDGQTQQQLEELSEYANGDGKELMLSWGFKPNADGEFTPQDLAKQIITFNWKFAEDPVDKPNQKNDTFTRAPIKKGPRGENLTGAVEYTDSGTGWHELTTEETPVDPMEVLKTGQEGMHETVSSGFSDATSKLGDLNATAEQIATNTAKSEEPIEESESSEPSEGESSKGNNSENALTNATKGGSDAVNALFTGNKETGESQTDTANPVEQIAEGIHQWATKLTPSSDPFNYGGEQGFDRTQSGRISSAEPSGPEEDQKPQKRGFWSTVFFGDDSDPLNYGGEQGFDRTKNGRIDLDEWNEWKEYQEKRTASKERWLESLTGMPTEEELAEGVAYESERLQANPVVGELAQAVFDGLASLFTGHNVNASEVTEGQDTSFVETQSETGQENGQSVENVSLNAQNVQVNDDTNTPGTLANGESLTPEQRQEYSSTPETEPKLYGSPRDPSLYSSTDYDLIHAHETDVNPLAQIWNSLFGGGEEESEVESTTINSASTQVNSEGAVEETDSTKTGSYYEEPTVEESSYRFMDPSNPFTYGQAPSLPTQESWQPPVPAETTTPSEVSTGDMSVTAGSVTVSGPVTTQNTQTETPSYNPVPATSTSESASANVSVDADTSAIETVTSALDEITDKTVTITVNEEGVSATSQALTAIYTTAGLVDGQSPTITVKEDGVSATSASLTAIYNTAQQVEGIDPNVIVNATDNASGKLENVISAAQTAGSQTPNVTVTESGSVNAVAKLNSVKSAADQADAKDPSITVTLNTGNTIGVLQSIRNTINSLPPSKTITITTVKREVQASGTFARGTFHPSHALGTVYGYASGTIGKYWDEYSRQNSLGAYAGGRNVALRHDQDALVNEVAVESIVFYVRTYTAMCMQLFIKLREYPKANQTTT